MKIQQHFRTAQFTQQSPESKNSSTEKCFSKYLSVSLKCRVPKFGVNRRQHSWVFCLLDVFKGTLSQFGKIARRGAAMGRLGSGVWLGSIKHCSSSSSRCRLVVQGGQLPGDGAAPPPPPGPVPSTSPAATFFPTKPKPPKPPYLIFLLHLHFPLACSTQGLCGAFSLAGECSWR